MKMDVSERLDLLDRAQVVNSLLACYGVKFGIYKNNTFHEQLFPFNPILRIIDFILYAGKILPSCENEE